MENGSELTAVCKSTANAVMKPAHREESATTTYTSYETWEDRQLGQISHLSLKSDSLWDAASQQLYYIGSRRGDLLEQNDPLRLEISLLDRPLDKHHSLIKFIISSSSGGS
jgi:hypothetical protein